MKAFVFADLHANYKYLNSLLKYLENNSEIDLILFAGDAVNMGEPAEFADLFVEVIDKINKPFLWVPGNNDFGRSYYKIQAKYKSLESRIVEYGNRKFTGVGGSPESWAGQYQGESIDKKLEIGGTIFVSHVPPPGALNFSRFDTNSPTGRRFADAPVLHICGHFHSRWGSAWLGQTKIINPGSLESGRYAILDLNSLVVDFKDFL